MAGRECHHCKQWIEEGEAHDCWTTTEAALTHDLSEDLRDAWERLRETAASFGDQRIYASGKCIMFSRRVCYFFVRPKRSYLELCVFLGRRLTAPQVRRVDHASKSKFYHLIRITHRDEVERPVTEWLQEAYEASDELSKGGGSKSTPAAEKQPAVRKRKSTQHQGEAPRKAGPASKRTQEKQLVRVRKICASIPGTMEKLSHGEPTFFTPKRVFAMFANNHHSDGHVAVWLPAAPGVQADLTAESPDTYFRPPYVGAYGWVGVELAKVDDEQLGALIREAFRFVNAKASSRRSSSSAKSSQVAAQRSKRRV
ncbi:MAG TPA: DUF5655 domain-containing protein [Bryobacteraceae bacterium]|nr:DUF5655 domain-containing protein [Bryobacteraceae bacterium]